MPVYSHTANTHQTNHSQRLANGVSTSRGPGFEIQIGAYPQGRRAAKSSSPWARPRAPPRIVGRPARAAATMRVSACPAAAAPRRESAAPTSLTPIRGAPSEGRLSCDEGQARFPFRRFGPSFGEAKAHAARGHPLIDTWHTPLPHHQLLDRLAHQSESIDSYRVIHRTAHGRGSASRHSHRSHPKPSAITQSSHQQPVIGTRAHCTTRHSQRSTTKYMLQAAGV